MKEKKNSELLIEEYRALRDEILSQMKKRHTTVVYSIVGIAALLGYGFTVKVGHVFLVPFSIIIPMSYLMKRTGDDILLLATYIYVAIEQDTDLRWETSKYYARKRESLERRIIPHSFDYILIYDLLSLVCITTSLLYANLTSTLAFVIGLIALYLLWWNHAMWGSFSFRRQKQYEKEIRLILEKT